MAALAEPATSLGTVPSRAGQSCHLWLSLLSFCLLRGAAVALVFSVVLAGGVATLAGGQAARVPRSKLRPQIETGPATFSGMLTDSNCGARHSRNSDLSSTECAHACIRSGARYVLVDGEKVFYLEGHLNQLEKSTGQRVEVRGTRSGETIQVDSIQAQ